MIPNVQKKVLKTLSVIESGEGEFYIEVTDKLENKKRVSKKYYS
ncbi:MAG: hypothetical protein KatS3mg002_0971 [Candidatus Woesearchaeota archaeon]|nr:MAG: hypothetical protein KatS3mg002_0971 [Candidatus Woesearchaeota archaeon]